MDDSRNDIVTAKSHDLTKRSALQFIILLGIVSLFADVTYEGARSIIGPFLATLGASAAMVGFVAGFGEFIGYALRFVSGYLTDKTGRYWLLTITGYTINVLAVPILALATRWELAVIFIVLERAGKAIRTPARDVMLSHASHEIGRGKGFGLHQLFDQIGATTGPVIVSIILSFQWGYSWCFAALTIPAMITLFMLGFAKHRYPTPHQLEQASPQLTTKRFSSSYWLYVFSASCIALGYADYPLIAYHFEKQQILKPLLIPLFYAAAMGASAISGLILGILFDKKGSWILIASIAASAFFAPLAFLGNSLTAFIGIILWGMGMGVQQSIMKAGIANQIPAQQRGMAYGTFNMVFGIAWFIGSAIMGILYDYSIITIVLFSLIIQLISLPLFFMSTQIISTHSQR